MTTTALATRPRTIDGAVSMPRTETATPSTTAARGDRLPPDPQWEVIRTRNESWRGVFVYAVRTTGIYCQPGCPSRRPRRENVLLFEDPPAARDAGFRACRRCRPDAAPRPAGEQRLVVEACRLLDQPTESPVPMREVADRVGVRPARLRKLFQQVLGISPKVYADAARIGRFRDAVHKEGLGVTDALYEAGFGASSRLYDQADRLLGMTPGRYRSRGRGEVIHHRIVSTRLGALLVAATERGLCRVALADEPASLTASLLEELGAATLVEGGGPIDAWAEALRSYVDGDTSWPTLPVDIAATAFQGLVYRALRAIPSGTRASYAEIAKVIGRPRAVRAVGRACATNPVGLAIPCHRVVPSSGGLGGYRWGLERKAALLEQERLDEPPAEG